MGKHTPEAEQRHLVARWRASTLPMSAFARAHGVQPGTFRSWVVRHEPGPEGPAASCSFIQVTTASATDAGFVVHVDDRALRFELPPPPAWFAAVLRELAC